MTSRVILNMRSDYVQQLDELVNVGVAPSRNALVERIIGGFLSDLKEQRHTENSALGSLVGFIILLLGIGLVRDIFSEWYGEKITMWWSYENQVLQLPCHTDIRILKNYTSRPENSGYYKSTGTKTSQAHWRKRLPDDRGIHVIEFQDHYLMHWDRVDPSCSLWGHLVNDAPLLVLFSGIVALSLLSEWHWARATKMSESIQNASKKKQEHWLRIWRHN